ncbi:MAG: anthranilate synthase component [Candidatus Atribacteria bacterium]|jgi:anthranilate synthase component 1|uniref:Anthranilate synthase component 1 n=1 Tax=Thermatribacter velox TaxID=3039681 RepID=A0ABZ2YAU1_9BACT|nr:anthranilate synthase component [Candidatus Atribacteria bacterium]MDI3531218.1 anthranilate synthase component [Candidatus Atribacteria bacterium]
MNIKPSIEDFGKIEPGEYDLVPLKTVFLADRFTPVSVTELFQDKKPLILLESAEKGERWGRFSFLIFDVEKVITINKFTDVIGKLERTFPLRKLYPGLETSFKGGAVGFLSYDAVKTWEKTVPRKPLSYPLAYFVESRRFVYFDHLRHQIGIVYLAQAGNEKDYQQGKAWIEGVWERISASQHISEDDEFSIQGEVYSNFEEEAFKKAVSKVIDYIVEGHASQVVISQRFSVPYQGNPFTVYRFLRSLNPSPYLFYLNTDHFQLVGSSPEMLVKLESGKAVTKPIAGTRKRLPNIPEDAIIRELLDDEKENAEHVMLLDLGRNDLGRVCIPGSVQVEEFMEVERYSHVFHIVSTVSGTVPEGSSAWKLLQACFPAGTVSGAPKVRAMEIIEEIEPDARGPYAGALGYVGFDGNMDTCIIIRTLFFKDGLASVQAGAGIVYDSKPQNEYEETVSKAQALLTALKMAEGRIKA